MNLDFSAIRNQKNLLAFSAGVDSTALFFLLLKQNIPFDIAIVDYNLRVQSKEEISYAKELALKYNKKIFVKDIKLESDSNFEKTARDIRYKFFEKIISENSYENLITAHQLNDKLEWFMMQLSKGAGLVELIGFNEFEQKETYKIYKTWLLEKRTLPILNTIVNIVVGVFYFLAWLANRKEKAFFWFAMTGAGWVIYSFCFLTVYINKDMRCFRCIS